MHGFLFVISGPSGVGKTTIAEFVLRLDSSIQKFVTCTTRNMRPGERNGVDYHFLSKEEFIAHVNAGDFIEYSEVYGNMYGVLASNIQYNIDLGITSLLVINWEGFLKIKKSNQVIGIFIAPPSMKELESRIRSRGDSEETIQKRLALNFEDMKHEKEYDHIVINDEIDKCAHAILKIIDTYRQT